MDLEVVSLDVESIPDLDGPGGRGPRIGGGQPLRPLMMDELFQCPKCWISFMTREGLEGHAGRPYACEVLRHAQTELARVPPLGEFLCGQCGKHCEATVETLEGVEAGERSECPFKAWGAHDPPR